MNEKDQVPEDNILKEDTSAQKKTIHPKHHAVLISLQVISWLVILIPVLLYFVNESFQRELNEALHLLASGDQEGLNEWVEQYHSLAFLVTGFLMIVQAIAAPVPAVFVTFTNSILFGWFIGGIWSIFSATIAASVCFFLAKSIGEPVLDFFMSEKTKEKSEELTEEFGLQAILVARLMPFTPFDPISYLAGMSGMRFRDFFLATLIGQIPAGMAYSYLAQQADNPVRFVTQGIGSLLALFILGYAFHKWKSLSKNAS